MALTAPGGDNVVAFDPAAARATSRSAPAGVPLSAAADSWELALDAAGKSPRTMRSYLDTVKALARWLGADGRRTEGVQTEDIQAFLVAERHRTSVSTAAVHCRNLSVFWKWILQQGERERSGNPMVGVERIIPPKKYYTDEQKRALLKTCAGSLFEDCRDTAIMRTFMCDGVRVGGLIGIRCTPDDPDTNDVDLKGRRIRVRLKGGDEEVLPIGKKAALAIDRYIRARAVTSIFLFLGIRGRNTERSDVPHLQPPRAALRAGHELNRRRPSGRTRPCPRGT